MGDPDALGWSSPAPLCDYCRTNDADAKEWLSAIGGDRFWFICFDCLEVVIERENAIAIRPELARTLPALPLPNWKER